MIWEYFEFGIEDEGEFKGFPFVRLKKSIIEKNSRLGLDKTMLLERMFSKVYDKEGVKLCLYKLTILYGMLFGDKENLTGNFFRRVAPQKVLKQRKKEGQPSTFLVGFKVSEHVSSRALTAYMKKLAEIAKFKDWDTFTIHAARSMFITKLNTSHFNIPIDVRMGVARHLDATTNAKYTRSGIHGQALAFKALTHRASRAPPIPTPAEPVVVEKVSEKKTEPAPPVARKPAPAPIAAAVPQQWVPMAVQSGAPMQQQVFQVAAQPAGQYWAVPSQPTGPPAGSWQFVPQAAPQQYYAPPSYHPMPPHVSSGGYQMFYAPPQTSAPVPQPHFMPAQVVSQPQYVLVPSAPPTTGTNQPKPPTP